MPIPGFIADLRRQVGSDLLWLPGVTAAILEDSHVLMARRADNRRWALISGIVEPGEEPADCLVREAREEVGIDIEVQALACVGVSPVVTYPNGDRAQYLDLTFLCRHIGGTPRVADDESLEVGWIPLDALPHDMTGSSRERLAAALDFQSNPALGTRFHRP